MKNVPFVEETESSRIREIVDDLIKNDFLPTPDELLRKRKIELIIKPKPLKRKAVVEVEVATKRTRRQLANDEGKNERNN